MQGLILPSSFGLIILAMTIGTGRVAADDKPTAPAVLAAVEHELQVDGTFELRRLMTEHLVLARHFAAARTSMVELERLAVVPTRQAAVAQLAIAAGDATRAAQLVESADLALAKLEGAEDYRDDVVRTFELLGNEQRATATFRRLEGDDRWICAKHVTEDLVRSGQLERAERWAIEASRGGDAEAWLAIASAWAERSDAKRARKALSQAVRLATKQKLLRGAHLARAAVIYASLGDGAKAATLARKVSVAEPMGGTADPPNLIRAALAGNDHESADKIVKEAWSGEWKPDLLQDMLVVARYYLAFDLPVPTREDTDRLGYAEKILAFVEAHVAGEKDEYMRIGLYANLARARLVTGDIVRAVEHANAVPQRATRLLVLIEIAARLRADAAAAVPTHGPRESP